MTPFLRSVMRILSAGRVVDDGIRKTDLGDALDIGLQGDGAGVVFA